MRSRLLFALAALSASTAFGEWKPPADPNPSAILQEAVADRTARRYEDALAKHVWFHEHALEYEQAQYGVRLSFALAYWAELGKVYSPAQKKLEEIRDETEKKVLANPTESAPFHDLTALNKTLQDEIRTRETFEAVEAKDAVAARTLYDRAQPALVKTKAYKLCGKYIDGPRDFKAAQKSLEEGLQLAKDPRFGPSLESHYRNAFRNKVTTLVALLVVNERKDEAETVAKSARAASDDTVLSKQLDLALEGKVPPPWP
ncbi:hypothetical protein [Planctomyces sp. SH-PL14]|uniref:hypothetical protein n=1 Tax=Planctomyces sp. SH-PL14 TaxID=1632864 RepID=UPI00078BF7DF|nr:hypothetical protein [Planctomyces sp. SH-PL14]AMV20386.1 hypothetical protein VT03_20985 [Planctomyces sp. SH-PL14]